MRLEQLLTQFNELSVRDGQTDGIEIEDISTLPSGSTHLKPRTLYLHTDAEEALRILETWPESERQTLCLLTPFVPGKVRSPNGVTWLEYWFQAVLPLDLSARLLRAVLTHQMYSTSLQSRRNEFVELFLTDRGSASLDRAREFGLELRHMRQIVLVGTEPTHRANVYGSPGVHELMNVIWRTVQDLGHHVVVSPIGHQVVVLLSGAMEGEKVTVSIARVLQQEFARQFVLAVLGERVNSAEELPRSFKTAQAALEIALKQPQLERWASFEALRPFLVYQEIQNHAHLRELIEGSLTPLLELPGEYRNVLLTTFLAYLEHGRSPTRAAEALGVHPNTLKYRMRRISSYLDLNSISGSQFILYYLAIQLNRWSDPQNADSDLARVKWRVR